MLYCTFDNQLSDGRRERGPFLRCRPIKPKSRPPRAVSATSIRAGTVLDFHRSEEPRLRAQLRARNLLVLKRSLKTKFA